MSCWCCWVKLALVAELSAEIILTPDGRCAKPLWEQTSAPVETVSKQNTESASVSFVMKADLLSDLQLNGQQRNHKMKCRRYDIKASIFDF